MTRTGTTDVSNGAADDRRSAESAPLSSVAGSIGPRRGAPPLVHDRARYRGDLALVRALVRGEDHFLDAVRARADWDAQAFRSFLHEQKLTTFAAPAAELPSASEVLGAPLVDALRAAGAESERRTAALIGACTELDRAFTAAGIDHLFFKGVVNGAWLYPRPARRYQRDVDVLVPRRLVPAALIALDRLGYDVSREADRGKPMEHRVDRMLSEPLHRRLVLKTPQHAACVRRGDDKVDLHWCVHGRYARRLGGTRLWSERRVVDVGVPLPALSTENALLALVIAIAEDLRRACVRAKLFLDLYLACRALSAELDWDAWLSRLRGDGLERLSANVFALLLDLWGCATELPSLADAVARRAELIETTTPDEALDLVSRATSDPANKLWFRRIHSATPLRRAVFRWSADLPHTLARTAGLRRTRLALWPTPRTA